MIKVETLTVDVLENRLQAFDAPEDPTERTSVLSLTIAPIGEKWEAVLVTRTEKVDDTEDDAFFEALKASITDNNVPVDDEQHPVIEANAS